MNKHKKLTTSFPMFALVNLLTTIIDNSIKTTFENRLKWLEKYYINVDDYDVNTCEYLLIVSTFSIFLIEYPVMKWKPNICLLSNAKPPSKLLKLNNGTNRKRRINAIEK